MAIYEFACEACQRRVEVVRRIGDVRPPEDCSVCGGGPMVRLMSRVAFHLSEVSRRQRIPANTGFASSSTRDMRDVGVSTENRLERMGVDLGERFREIVDHARSGELLGRAASELP